jgi:hypothetical protein
MVAWLASDDAADVSGQVFIVLGDQIHRMQPAQIAATVVAGDHRWTLDEISARSSELFAEVPSGAPLWGGPPM